MNDAVMRLHLPPLYTKKSIALFYVERFIWGALNFFLVSVYYTRVLKVGSIGNGFSLKNEGSWEQKFGQLKSWELKFWPEKRLKMHIFFLKLKMGEPVGGALMQNW